MLYRSDYSSPIGKIIIVSDSSHLLFLGFENQGYLDKKWLAAEEKVTPISSLTKEWLSLYFSGKNPSLYPPISLANLSSFRQKAYEILMKLPYGEVVTYKDVAIEMEKESGKRISCQAIGGAISHNPIAIIIPCHRVIGSNGKLVGYNGGLDRKKYLLELEGSEVGNSKRICLLAS